MNNFLTEKADRLSVFGQPHRCCVEPPPSVVEMICWVCLNNGTDAAGDIGSAVSAPPKLAAKSVQGCTLFAMRHSRCPAFPALLKIACWEAYIRVRFSTTRFMHTTNLASVKFHGHPCPFWNYKARAQINHRHGKNVPPCTFLPTCLLRKHAAVQQHRHPWRFWYVEDFQ